MEQVSVDTGCGNLERVFTECFPGTVCVLRPVMELQGKLFEIEKEYVKNVGPRRKREFTAGRTAGRLALRELGVVGVPLPRGETGEPVWPFGVVGSLSHSRQYCFCLAARHEHFCSIGVDIENTTRMREELTLRVLTDEERVSLSRLPSSLFLRYASLLFSAKEAFFKFQFRFTGKIPGLRDVAFHIDPRGMNLKLRTKRGDFYGPQAKIAYGFYGEWVAVAVAARAV